VLARLVGAELQVSQDGELLFVFEKPGALRRSVSASSLRQRVRDTWTTASPPILWLARASFGLGLLASLALVTTAITALASSKDDRSSSSASSLGMMWGPSPLDFLYYSTRPRYGYVEPTGEKGFLQSCFSLLFGDGDPNLSLPERTSAAAAALIRANDGAVTAEQLAPLLAPMLDPEQAAEEEARPGAPVREDWMLPLLLQFNGEPVVTDEGDLVYIFPELMSTADDSTGGSVAAIGAAGGAMTRRSSGSGELALREALAYEERPAGWRPAINERVTIARVGSTRGRDDQAAARYVGMQGTVLSDDRDGLPFGVSFSGFVSADGTPPRPDAFFGLNEILPVGVDADMALRELPQRFSTAPPSQLALAGVLGAANFGAVLYLGSMLTRLAGVPAASLGSAGPLIQLLRRAYLPLLVYASGFVGVPAVRAAIVRRRNRAIEARNERRGAWARAIGAAQSDRGGGGGEGVGLRARLARKLKAARNLRPRLRRFRRDEDATYSTESDIADAAAGGSAPLPGSSFDDFDRRLSES